MSPATTVRTTRRHVCGLAAWLLLCVSVSAEPQTNNTQAAHAQLAAEVRELLVHRAAERFPTADIEVTTLPLDPRLGLSACDELSLAPRSERVYGRVPVAVRCLGPLPWSVFLTGEVNVTLPVVVAGRSLTRGSRLTAADLHLAPRDLARLRSRYLTDTDAAVDMALRSPVAPDAVIYATMIEPALAVRRGDRVTILAKRGAVAIRANGEALQDGHAGAQIPVRNRQSERTVHAWIRGPGLVATSP